MITIEEILAIAESKKASDLHIAAGVSPKCRINSELTEIGLEILQPGDIENLVKPMLTHNTEETLEEEGEVEFAYAISEVKRCRVNLFKQRGSYSMVIHLVATVIPDPNMLSIPSSVVELTKQKRGLVLVTGPTGSGKSTTLASLIDVINQNRNAHIITLENPIEYLHFHQKSIVNQREIGLDTKSYSNALQAALREDPDVILVGEMRDMDTIATALTAAETGHLVFAGLHTVGTTKAIDRMIDVFPSHYQQQIRVQLASVLEAVVYQQLIPTIDEKGRMAAYEVMHSTAAIKNLIREGKTHQITSIMHSNKKLGMQTMDDALYELYLKRMINIDNVINFAQDVEALEKKIE